MGTPDRRLIANTLTGFNDFYISFQEIPNSSVTSENKISEHVTQERSLFPDTTEQH